MSEHERTIVRVAKSTAKALAFAGACYRATLFMRYHLDVRHGISSEAAVGYVNDGTDNLYSSHAWLETDGRRTDVALCRPLDPSIQKVGAFTILDREIAPGWPYTYHRNRPPEAMAEILGLLRDPHLGEAITAQEDLHLRMVATTKSKDLIRAYLDGSPDGLTYDRLATMVEA